MCSHTTYANKRKKHSWRVWWRLLRPHTLTAAIIPVTVGTILAYQNNVRIDLILLVLMLFASIIIQSATNMFNEYYDFINGLDTEKSVGIGGAIVRDGVNAAVVLYLALSFYAAAVIAGIYICYKSSWWLALIGLAGMAVGYFYTGGPCPIASTPFGEIFSGTFMGIGIIQISYFIQAHKLQINSLLVSIPFAIMIGAILLANNIRDLDGDKAKGRRTLAIILGREKAIILLSILFVLVYIWSVILITNKILPYWCLLVFLSIPIARKAVQGFKGKKLPAEMMPAMQSVAKTNTVYGLLLSLGIIINRWF